MDKSLDTLFESISDPVPQDEKKPVYAVARIMPSTRFYVGKDVDGLACILIETDEPARRSYAPIRLESLDVRFQLKALLRAGDKVTEGAFTVIGCRSDEPQVVRYFLSICETILQLLGEQPTNDAIANIVNRLALIFQRLQNPPSRPVNGLFGELFLMRNCVSPLAALTAWRVEETSRFDFSAGDVRLDVKTATGRSRAHNFSYDQCNPPKGTHAFAASLFVERSSNGVSLSELIAGIETFTVSSSDLVMKLHSVVATTLGKTMPEALRTRFDEKLAASSLQFYDLQSIPAIRDNLPAGVSDVHFRSDLTSSAAIQISELIARDPKLGELLPAIESR